MLIGSDGSTDATEAIVTAYAARDPRVHLLALPRSGQTATQAALFAAARGEVVVLTDAETRFATAVSPRWPRRSAIRVSAASRAGSSGAMRPRRRRRRRKGSTGATNGVSASSRAGPAC